MFLRILAPAEDEADTIFKRCQQDWICLLKSRPHLGHCRFIIMKNKVPPQNIQRFFLTNYSHYPNVAIIKRHLIRKICLTGCLF